MTPSWIMPFSDLNVYVTVYWTGIRIMIFLVNGLFNPVHIISNICVYSRKMRPSTADSPANKAN